MSAANPQPAVEQVTAEVGAQGLKALVNNAGIGQLLSDRGFDGLIFKALGIAPLMKSQR